jgi:hypothetical protein
MYMRQMPCLTLALLGSLAALPAFADDIRPEARTLSDARTYADEKCVEKCDIESDKCMQDAEGDAGKVQACDDKYSECLQACEAG